MRIVLPANEQSARADQCIDLGYSSADRPKVPSKGSGIGRPQFEQAVGETTENAGDVDEFASAGCNQAIFRVGF
jgi:hypothetical protein